MKKRFIIFYVATFCIVIGLSFAMPASSTILFYEDFEDELDFTNQWKEEVDHGTHEPTTEQVRAGSKAHKFSLTRYDSGDFREELLLKAKIFNGDFHFTIGSEYWIGFSIFLADGYHTPQGQNGWIVHHQYHSLPDGPPTCPEFEGYARQAPLTLQTNNKEGVGIWRNCSRYDSRQCSSEKKGSHITDYGAYSTGCWVDYVINIKWDYDSDGVLKIWKDGVLQTDVSGGTCFNDDVGPYLKIGIYSKVLDDNQTITIYYDELRIGDSDSSYAEVAPGGGSEKPLPPTSVRIIDK